MTTNITAFRTPVAHDAQAKPGPFNFKNEEWGLKYLPWVRLSSVIAHPAFISDDQLKATSDEEAAELVRHLQATANHLLDLVDTIQLALDRLTELRQQ